MTEVLDSGHVITDEDVDTARLIMELDRALGRPTDSLTKRVARSSVGHLEAAAGPVPNLGAKPANGHPVPAGDALVRAITSEENAAELAREVGEQLPDDLDPVEQARVVARVQNMIRRRLIELVAEVRPGR